MTSGTTIFVVAAPPRSGTQWYSRLFTTDRSYCFHELTTVLRPYPTNWAAVRRVNAATEDDPTELRSRRLLLEAYPEYFRRHWEHARSGQDVVGNSDAGALTLLLGIWLLWPATKFLYSVRNGINVVHSTAQTQPQGADIFLQTVKDDFFGRVCERWARTMLHLERDKVWLLERGADVVETHLEAMTTDVEELRRVWDWLVGDWQSYEDRNRALMSTPANVRTNERRIWSADEIWERWTPRQREIFTENCSEAQVRLGYAMPTIR